MTSSTMKSIAVVVAGVVAGLLMWGIFKVAGIDLDLKESAAQDQVGAAEVVIASVFGGVAAWLVYWLLRRWDKEGWWPFVGSTALALSINGPSWMADGDAVAPLIAMHFAVGIVLIIGFAWFVGGRTAEGRDNRSDAARNRQGSPQPR